MSRQFLDTNILVYSIDLANLEKRDRALAVIETLARSRNGVISTQVLQEFYVAATRKLGLDLLVAKAHVKRFEIFDIVQVQPDTIHSAIDRSILSQLSFWDSLIVTAAKTGRCDRLISEDLHSGQNIDGVVIENPFL